MKYVVLNLIGHSVVPGLHEPISGLTDNVCFWRPADDFGQKPIHLAAQSDKAEVVKMFLKQRQSLVSVITKVRSARLTFPSWLYFAKIFVTRVKTLWLRDGMIFNYF